MAAWQTPKQMVILPRTPPPPPGEEPDPVAVVKAMAALREKGDGRRGSGEFNIESFQHPN